LRLCTLTHTQEERQCQTADGHNLRPLKAVSRGKCQLLALTFQIGRLTLVHSGRVNFYSNVRK
jgi:hypothetical protein